MAGPPPPPPGFVMDGAPPPKPQSTTPAPPPGYRLDAPTGEAHDGDTFRLTNGENARLYGFDAFELGQKGYFRNGIQPIGVNARDYLRKQLSPDDVVFSAGSRSYNRPVVTVDANGSDLGKNMLDAGWGLATPQYLRADPTRFGDYMEAERLARLNRRGAFAGKFQTPADYRHKVPDPWAKPEWGSYGNGVPVFFDEPTPFQGLRPEIEKGYLQIWADPNSTADQLLAYAKENGFSIDPEATRKVYAERAKGRPIDASKVRYAAPPRLLTNPGDGALGAGLRGFADPINMLDEMGGMVDTLGGTKGRENVWNSDRRFGDIYSNNVDQNRSILAYDDANHPYVRFGGQMASGLVMPGASVEGVGLNAARAAIRSGASRFTAVNAAKTAVRRRLALGGTVEGSLAGFGSGEDWKERGTNAVLGGATGAALGYLTAAGGQELLPRLTALPKRFRVPKPPEGYVIDQPANATPLNVAPDIAAASERVNPSDILPIPANEVGSIQEAAGIEAGRYAPVRAVDENSVLQSRSLPSPTDATRTLPKRGPLDLATWLRTQGGVQDQGGELSHLGIDNKGRDLDFARGEARFGNIVAPDGMTLDQAADAAWRAGYFPDHAERPTITEFVDALGQTHRGFNRSFRPDDLAEVDAFNAARDQRYAVEKAKQEGAPLFEDRSQPTSEADVAGNAPPVSAYEEWPAGGPDFAGNIRLDKLDTPQDIKRALVQTHNRVGFDAATRGRVTYAETERLASDLGMTPEQLLSRRKGQALNAEEALAARQILAKSGNELVNLARRVQRMDNPGDEVLAAFRQAWVRHVAIQEQVSGMTAEAGRALQQFRMTARSSGVHGDVLSGLVKAGGGQERLKDVAGAIVDLERDPGALNRFALQASKPRFRDKLIELWYNSLLSGPQTHVVNVVSNTMTSLAQLPEHAAAAAIGGARRIAARKAVNDRVLFTELGARSFGLLQGVKEGLREAARTFKTGEASDFVSKVEAQSDNAISGLKGKIVRIPTRALSAEDELFKAMARRMELSGLAVRQAKAEGLKGEAAKRRVADLLANPTDDMLDKSFDYGRYLTFQRPLGPVMRHVSAMTENMPLLKLVVPFVRTPANLLKFSIERSPAAPLLKEWRAEVMAGGARRDLALARAAVGSGVGALIMELAANGNITGNGPADDEAKQLLRADGWQPYSIRVGDKYYSYQRLDPFSTTFGVAADMVELQDYMTEKQREKVALLVTASIMRNLSSKTWLSGISDLTEAINDPERSASGFFKRLVGSMVVPAGVAQVARTVDPTLREAESILDAVKQRVPFLSKNLPARRDVWGRPVVSEGGTGPDIISPIWMSSRKNDPINNEILRLGANVGQPRREVGGVRLDADQWGRYRELAGQLGRSSIGDLIAAPEWRDLSTEEKQDAISDYLGRARKEARGKLFPASVPPPPPGFSVDPPPAGYVLDR